MLDTLHFWHWWVLAIVLVIIELTLSGAYFFLWIAVAAAVTGVLAWLVPGMVWEWQLFAFAVLSLASVFLWRRFKPKDSASDQPALNRRGEQYVGRLFTLEHPVVNGFGKLTVADTTWKVAGDDLPAGTRVRVTRVEGTALHIERAEDAS